MLHLKLPILIIMNLKVNLKMRMRMKLILVTILIKEEHLINKTTVLKMLLSLIQKCKANIVFNILHRKSKLHLAQNRPLIMSY